MTKANANANEQSKDAHAQAQAADAALAETEIAPTPSTPSAPRAEEKENITKKRRTSSAAAAPAGQHPSAPPSSPSSSKRLVGRFRLDKPLGSGGMGDVYRAHDPMLDRAVALKVMRADAEHDGQGGAQRLRRVVREARAAAALMHPNTVTIFEVGEADNEVFIAMELLEGEDLRAILQRGDASLEDKLRWLLEAARALEAAHERGLVHRDVKPENMFVCKGGGTLKLLDFGIAKRDDNTATAADDGDEMEQRASAPPSFGPSSLRTQEGRRVGTPRYMAPEQHVGQSTDARTDEYAWGLVAFELITGAHPVESLETITGEGRNGEASVALAPSRFAELQRKVPDDIARTITRALEMRKEDRFESMTPIVEALEANAEYAEGQARDRDRDRRMASEEKRVTTSNVAAPPMAAEAALLVPTPAPSPVTTEEPPNSDATRQPEKKRSRRWLALPIAAVILLLGSMPLTVPVIRERMALARIPPPACRVESTRSISAGPDDRVTILPDGTLIFARNVKIGLTFEREMPDGTMAPYLKSRENILNAFPPNAYEDVALGGVLYNNKPTLTVALHQGHKGALLGLWGEEEWANQRIIGETTGIALTNLGQNVVLVSTSNYFAERPRNFASGVETYLLSRGTSLQRMQIEIGTATTPSVAATKDRAGVAYTTPEGIRFALVDGELNRIGDVMHVASAIRSPHVAFSGDDPVVFWTEDSKGRTRLKTASFKLGQKAFSEPKVAIDEPLTPNNPFTTRLPNGTWALVWASSVGGLATIRVSPIGAGGALTGPTNIATAPTIGNLRATATERGLDFYWFESSTTGKVAHVICDLHP